jgi:hypothetical protein
MNKPAPQHTHDNPDDDLTSPRNGGSIAGPNGDDNLPPPRRTQRPKAKHHHVDAQGDDAIDAHHVHDRVHGNDDVDGDGSHGDNGPGMLSPAASVRTVRHLVLFHRRPAGGAQ